MSQVFIHAQKDGLAQEGTYIQNIPAKEYASHVAYCKNLPEAPRSVNATQSPDCEYSRVSEVLQKYLKGLTLKPVATPMCTQPKLGPEQRGRPGLGILEKESE